jgi:lactonase
MRRAVRALPVLVLGTCLVGCTASADAAEVQAARPAAAGSSEQVAERFVQVTSPHEATGRTLLEGVVLDGEGGLVVVDVNAPPREPKVLRVDVESGDVTPLYTDPSGVYTSAQLSPYDGRLYVTDLIGGRILSMTLEGKDPTTFFSGDVDGAPTSPDDIAFDQDGNLFVTDATGYVDPMWEAQGRVVRIDREFAEATVLAEKLPATNGISFTPEYDGLWVSHNMGNRIDHLLLDEDGTEVATAWPGMFVSGGTSTVDSTAVDAGGNVYVGLHGQPTILVYSAHGELLSTVTVPAADAAGLHSATNLAIEPGTTDGYMTVSGPDGGFIYTFTALDEGIRQSNGG